MALPLCSPEVVPEIRQALRELGRGWAAARARPVIAGATLKAWERLLDQWIADPQLPLLVRKFRRNRGSIIRMPSGRAVIPTDNSPAQWAFAIAYDGECPRISDVAQLFAAGRIPIAMALSGGPERENAVYRGVRGRCPGTADAGWKLAHLVPVGLGGRGPLESYSADALERHFRLLMSPSNMFVVPSAWAGLAEVDDFVEGFRSHPRHALGRR